MTHLRDTTKMVRYVSNLDTSEFSRPRWCRRVLLALCVLAVICVEEDGAVYVKVKEDA